VPVGFLSPLFLIGLLAAAVPILLHLLRRRAEPVVPFSAVQFLRRVPVEHARRRRLRELVLLALRTAALVLLALSFARPYLVDSEAAADALVTIIAMDTSLSVSTPDQVTTARTLAEGVSTEAPAAGTVALIRFDDRAEVVVPPTLDRSEVRAGIARVTPGAGGTRYGAMLAAASDLAGGRPARLVVISDLQRWGWESGTPAPAPPTLDVRALDIGPPSSNLAIVDIRRVGQGVTAVVHNESETRRAVPVTLSIDGRPVATESLPLEPGRTRHVQFTVDLPKSGVLAVRVDDPDGYVADNERFLVLDPPPRPRVLAITRAGGAGEAFYLERAVGAVEGADGMLVERVGMERLVASPDLLPGYAAVVVFGSSGLDRRTADALAQAAADGTGLLFVAGPGLELAQVAAQLPPGLGVRAGRVETPETPVSFAPVDVRHPIFRPFAPDGGLLGSVRFRRVLRVTPDDDSAVLARFSDGSPALVELGGGGRRVLLFASDLASAWNDFARHPAFVPFVHELVRYLVASRPAERDVHVGQLPGMDGQHPGIVELPVASPAKDGAQVRRVAVNTEPRESQDTRMTPDAFVAAVPRTGAAAPTPRVAVARARESEQSWWRYGLALMLLGLVAESLVGRRT
jgi:hypothetical protein